jgi:predicted DNA-binding protein
MSKTRQQQFRLSEETIQKIEALMAHLDLPSKTTTVRVAINRMYRDELRDVELPKPKKKR